MNPDVKIIVNEEKRTVVAIATDCTADAMNELLKCDSNAHVLLAINVGNDTCRPLISDSILLPDTFVGVAHCHPDDEFDIAVGRRIALRKRTFGHRLSCCTKGTKLKNSERFACVPSRV